MTDFYTKTEASRKNPLCVADSPKRVVRGGHWDRDAARCRSAGRNAMSVVVIEKPASRFPSFGAHRFRTDLEADWLGLRVTAPAPP